MNRKPSSLRTVVAAVLIVCAQMAVAQVTVLDPWVRGTVEGQTSTGAYMTLKSDTGARLVAVTSPVATRSSIHEVSMNGNVMRMRTLESLPIPAGSTVALEEGHDHLMLEGLSHALKEGDKVRLTLTFVDSGGKKQSVDVQAPVRPLGAPAPAASGSGSIRHTTPMTR
jgi:periplasmic copper chaperone A